MTYKIEIHLKNTIGFCSKAQKILEAHTAAPQKVNQNKCAIHAFYDYLFGMKEILWLYTSEQIHGATII